MQSSKKTFPGVSSNKNFKIDKIFFQRKLMINVDCSVYHRILISFEVSKIINVKMQRPLLKCNFLS